MEAHPIESTDDARAFVLAGRAVFSLKSKTTGNHFTYRVKRAKGKEDGRPWFVSVLVGPRNTSDYAFIGCLFPNGGKAPKFVRTKKARENVKDDAQSVRGFRWFWDRVACGGWERQATLYHEGRCGRCGRTLTVPESVTRGLGPTCAGS